MKLTLMSLTSAIFAFAANSANAQTAEASPLSCSISTSGGTAVALQMTNLSVVTVMEMPYLIIENEMGVPQVVPIKFELLSSAYAMAAKSAITRAAAESGSIPVISGLLARAKAKANTEKVSRTFQIAEVRLYNNGRGIEPSNLVKMMVKEASEFGVFADEPKRLRKTHVEEGMTASFQVSYMNNEWVEKNTTVEIRCQANE